MVTKDEKEFQYLKSLCTYAAREAIRFLRGGTVARGRTRDLSEAASDLCRIKPLPECRAADRDLPKRGTSHRGVLARPSRGFFIRLGQKLVLPVRGLRGLHLVSFALLCEDKVVRNSDLTSTFRSHRVDQHGFWRKKRSLTHDSNPSREIRNP